MSTRKPEVCASAAQIPELAPMRILEVELGQPLSAVSAIDEKTSKRYLRALCLVRLHTKPLGIVELQLGESGVNADEYARYIWDVLHEQINKHLQQDGLPSVTGLSKMGLLSPEISRCLEERERFLAQAPFVSVIVATHDRPERLKLCLRSLLDLHYPHYEIIIVDNAPSTNATADVVQQIAQGILQPQIYYLREDHPGLSLARNSGILAARGEILAFADDDVVVDRYWLVELVRGFFLAKDVVCVTGLLLPLELETPPQLWFEEYYRIFSWSSRALTERIFNIGANRADLSIYRPGQLGQGASMAFTAAFLRNSGGFDPALGAGRKAGGEDIAAFIQAVMRGYTLVHEPASLAYHLYRRDYEGLRKQIYGYGVGFTAYLMKIIFDSPRPLFELVIKLPYALFSFVKARSQKNEEKLTSYPKELKIIELKGLLYGALSFVYVRNRWETRNARKFFALAEAHIASSTKRKAVNESTTSVG